ncbi:MULTISPECIES: nuclear transport factor 2 family protein [unclassified Polaribacter]|uniref:nuclear transport factor 2 family protein n=1 Tax=unclassified Polaribacter TaxID=196858 RepID=UPI0011BFD379|nr:MULTISPECIES: nuclear transport factor 2 family protein [unclassified Polaribacter]TXD53267.1 nuclear transport factor 2 family protein [Polaribacter sp. IC063]TXD60279.1 nuclear transport factor 2 family protein [Polaribacter sp. IC066]
MLKNLLVYFLLICPFSLICQEKENVLQEIQSTIQNYYDGYIERDLNKLNKAFDIENGTMKILVIENDVVTGYKNAFFKELIPIWGTKKKLSKEVLANCALVILNIDVVNKKIASAKISMQVDTVTYIDILSL